MECCLCVSPLFDGSLLNTSHTCASVPKPERKVRGWDEGNPCDLVIPDPECPSDASCACDISVLLLPFHGTCSRSNGPHDAVCSGRIRSNGAAWPRCRTKSWRTGCLSSRPSWSTVNVPTSDWKYIRELLGKFEYVAVAGVAKLRSVFIPLSLAPRVSLLWHTRPQNHDANPDG